jgi:tripartite-type tricarboxylate transporter receptor subunit TctC
VRALRQRVRLMAFLAAGIVGGGASAQEADYPNREIRLVSGYAPGSGADLIARYLADKLSTITGRSVFVDNRVGANGNIAHQYVARQKPDGYTIYPVSGSALGSSVHLLKSPPVDPLRDFEFLGPMFRQGFLVVVDAKAPFRTLQDLTAHLKARGTKGSYGVATSSAIVLGELYKRIAGVETVQINYRAIGDSLHDLLDGTTDFSLADAAWSLPQIKGGLLRPLAIGTSERIKALADIPTMAEGGVPGVDVPAWWGVNAPAGLPKPISQKITGWFDQILSMPDTETFFAAIGTDIWRGTPEEHRARLEQEMKLWGEYVRIAKIEPM